MNNKTRFCADIGANHNHSLPRCLSLIHTAKAIGCWGVKFQLFKGDKLYRDAPEEIVNNLKKRELPIEWLSTIRSECNRASLKFGCTPFYLEAVNILEPYVDFFKISSFDVMRKDLIKACIGTNKKLMVSLGLCIDRAEELSIVNGLEIPFNSVLFHCVSKYPTKYNEANLINIKYLKNGFNYKIGWSDYIVEPESDFSYKIGWSDHTVEPAVIYQAVACGAKYIEFHLDSIDRQGWESHSGHCWVGTEIAPVIDTVNKMEESIGNEKFLNVDNEWKIKIRANGETGLREW